MRKTNAAALLCLAAVAAAAQSMPKPEQANIAWIAEGEFCEPETVLALPDDTLLVSNVCDFREQGNGFLSRLGANGETIAWQHVDGLDAPLGMALHDDALYVVDNNRIKIFGWPDFEHHETIELTTKVANDIAIGGDGSIYITDTADGLVVHIGADRSQSIFTDKAQFPGANGIAINNTHVFVGGARLWKVALADQGIETVGPEWLADIDGIEFEGADILQITPVGGPLVRLRDNEVINILGGDGVGSANHGYAAALGLALIPTGFDNQVIAIRLAD